MLRSFTILKDEKALPLEYFRGGELRDCPG